MTARRGPTRIGWGRAPKTATGTAIDHRVVRGVRRAEPPPGACFDSAFHRRMPPVAKTGIAPRRRAGFSAVSTDYRASSSWGSSGDRLIVARLGIDTTMRVPPMGRPSSCRRDGVRGNHCGFLGSSPRARLEASPWVAVREILTGSEANLLANLARSARRGLRRRPHGRLLPEFKVPMPTRSTDTRHMHGGLAGGEWLLPTPKRIPAGGGVTLMRRRGKRRGPRTVHSRLLW